ncbi:hypothetical protein V8E55_003425 [Tylopilus felleus]
MPFCLICFLRRLHRSQQINPPQQHPSSPSSDLTAELKDSRKFSLGLLTALLPILAISLSKALQPVALTLLIYIISLRVSIQVDACFHQNYPAVSRFLHVIPLLGTSCMAVVELVSRVQSPVLATVSILLGALPLVTLVIHHGRHCAATSAA